MYRNIHFILCETRFKMKLDSIFSIYDILGLCIAQFLLSQFMQWFLLNF